VPKIVKRKKKPSPDTTDTDQGELNDRLRRLETLWQFVVEPPEEWIKEGSESSVNKIDLIECESYASLLSAWEEAMQWTEGLDHALSVMLASITSTLSLGDQLWVKVLAPAASGKSTLCEALSANAKYVMAKSTIRGFHSGFGDGDEDHSLVSRLNGKTLIIKDGDTLLQSPNLSQILSEARDIYDTVSRTSYRNKNSRDYTGIRCTILLCGTSSLRALDSSELGERFLDCVMMDGICDDMEDAVLQRVAKKARANLCLESGDALESQDHPDMLRAKALTGGYIDYLRRNATSLLKSCEFSEKRLNRCARFAKLVAYMRARPSTMQTVDAERECAYRLASQFIRLANCLGVVFNRSEVDDDILKRTRRVALDTARGPVMEMTHVMYEHGEEGIEPSVLAKLTTIRDSDVRGLLRFLRKIKVVEPFESVSKGKSEGRHTRKVKWKLTDQLTRLYEEVME
jgi:hypothetical protein